MPSMRLLNWGFAVMLALCLSGCASMGAALPGGVPPQSEPELGDASVKPADSWS